MALREYNWVCLKQDIDTAVQKLRVYQWTCQWKEGEKLLTL